MFTRGKLISQSVNPMKVLIVEDSQRLRHALGEGLRRSGFTVDLAQDGEEGLNLASAIEYDVIVLDIVMPKLDGLSLLKEIRKKQNPANVIILSAKDMVEDRVEGLELGADDYMVKPFSFDELLARIKTLGRRKYEHKSPMVEIGQVTLDTSLREVRANDELLQLTRSEYNILEQLMLRHGRVISKTQLMEWISESNSSTTSNVVEVMVSSLRKKLEQINIEGFIKTKRGFGYYIE